MLLLNCILFVFHFYFICRLGCTNSNIVAQTMKKKKICHLVVHSSRKCTDDLENSAFHPSLLPVFPVSFSPLKKCIGTYTYISFTCATAVLLHVSDRRSFSLCNEFKILWTSMATLPCHNEFSLLSFYIYFFRKTSKINKRGKKMERKKDGEKTEPN